LAKLSYDYPGSTGEDHLLISASLDSGEALPEEAARALFDLKAKVGGTAGSIPSGADAGLASAEEVSSVKLRRGRDDRNKKFMREEIAKVDAWTTDQQAKYRSHYLELEKKFIDLGREIARCDDFRQEVDLVEEKAKVRSRMTREESDYHQQVLLLEEKSAAILKASKARLSPNESLAPVFLIRWTLA
jgi:hypothetical protein